VIIIAIITLEDVRDIWLAIQTAVESIKDTDGIKKITDPLPAGTNLLGKVEIDGNYIVQDITIALGETESTEIDFSAYKYLSFLMPSAWDTATITIKGSATTGGTKVDIYNGSGVSLPEMDVDVDRIYSVDRHALNHNITISSIPYLAIVSSAIQTAERTIKVMCKS
jgi:hypothetical protein